MHEGPGLGAAILVTLLIIAIVDVPLLLIARATATEGVGVNHAVGIRLPSLMRSPEAWRAGHLAALRPITVGVVVSVIAAVSTIALSAMVVPYIVMLSAAILAALVGLAIGTVRAHRAAVHVTGTGAA